MAEDQPGPSSGNPVEIMAQGKSSMEQYQREIAPTLGLVVAGERCSEDSERGIRMGKPTGNEGSR
jgi:hypothetical protein